MVLTLRLGATALLGENCLDARDVAAQDANAAGVFHLAVGPLEAQVELLFLHVRELGVQLVGVLDAEVLGLGRGLGGGRLLGGLLCCCFLGHLSIPYRPVRWTNFVAIDNFAWPRRIASFAVLRSTPSISNRMRPGLTLA